MPLDAREAAGTHREPEPMPSPRSRSHPDDVGPNRAPVKSAELIVAPGAAECVGARLVAKQEFGAVASPPGTPMTRRQTPEG